MPFVTKTIGVKTACSVAGSLAKRSSRASVIVVGSQSRSSATGPPSAATAKSPSRMRSRAVASTGTRRKRKPARVAASVQMSTR